MDKCRKWQEQISASLDGELSPEEEKELQKHLEGCRSCRTTMALLRGMTGVMREDLVRPPDQLAEGARFLFEREKKDKGLHLRRWRFTAIAAVICLALLGVVKLAPWSAGTKNAAPAAEGNMNDFLMTSKMRVAASAPAEKNLLSAAGGMLSEPAPEAAEEPAAGNAWSNAREDGLNGTAVYGGQGAGAAPAATPAAPDAQASAVSPAVTSEPAEERGAETEAANDMIKNAVPGSPMYFADSLPGYAIYSGLENAAGYYSVCFTYGEVPETIRKDQACTQLEAPEGQERWLVPLSVCLNEGLLEQFSEVYYGDLLSQQGLVIGILDMEEDQWQP